MISVRSYFHPDSHRFVSFNNTSIFCLVFSNCATSFPVLLTLSLAGHCRWHRNFQLSTRILHEILEFFIIWINEVKTTQFSSFVELRFFDSPLTLNLSLRFDASDISFQISGHRVSGLEVVCFLVSLLPDHVYPSGGFSLRIVNLVKPVHASDNSQSPSTFQLASICFSNSTSKDVSVVLVTSLYKRFSRLSQADHRISSLPIRAKYKHFGTM